MARRPAKYWRDDLRMGAGIVGLAYEAVLDKHREPSLILVFAALTGIAVPGFIDRSKEKRDHAASGDSPAEQRSSAE